MSQVGESIREVGEDPEEIALSILSQNSQERIAARSLRIANVTRNKTQDRLEIEHDSGQKEIKEDIQESQCQVEQSQMTMSNCLIEGTELVTSIRVAADARESQRRIELEEARRIRMESLERNAKSSLEKFDEIMRELTMAKTKVIPQELKEVLNSQQDLCAKLMGDKDKLITELQQELKLRDNQYVKDLKRYEEEQDMMIERMADQIKDLMKTYTKEMNRMEKAYEQEHKSLLTGNRKQWEQCLKDLQEKELENLTQWRRKVEEYEALLQQQRLEDAEDYHLMKEKHDTDIHDLQRELADRKAIYQKNQDTMEFNYVKLKKRQVENIITKSQQKRKINKQQDALNNLRATRVNQEKQARVEIQKLSVDIQRLTLQHKDLETKIKHFSKVSTKQYKEIWLINEEEVKELVERALDIDRIIHEQQLGLAWHRPPLPFMEGSGPIQKQAERAAHQAASQLIRTRQAAQSSPPSPSPSVTDASVGPGSETDAETEVPVLQKGTNTEVETRGSPEEKLSEKTGIKEVLKLLCDEAGFLCESKLQELISPLENADHSLKVAPIFSAIGIESEDDLNEMAEFFQNYRHQQKQAEKDVCAGTSMTDISDEDSSDFIHSNDVLRALKAFTAQHKSKRSAKHQHYSARPGGKEDSEIEAYWQSMAEVIPEDKLKTWDALEKALEKYYAVLRERSDLINETQRVKQMNAELRSLLHQSLSAQVNTEQMIPLTQKRM